MRKILVVGFLLGLFVACQPVEQKSAQNKMEGPWLATIMQNDSTVLNFNAEVVRKSDSSFIFRIRNADEILEAQMLALGEDSFKIEMPVFANHFLVKVEGERMYGKYVNPDAEDYYLPFEAKYGKTERYPNTQNLDPLNGYWRIDFNPSTEKVSSGKAYFEVVNGEAHGTIMTSTGDFRYLQGSAAAGQLYLSAFDGAHVYSFEATLYDTIQGRFYSGRSYMAPFIMYKDESFELPDPDTLTYLKEGYSSIDFAFPNLEGDTIRLSDERFKDKALILQISGSWCPNCYDESKYLSEVYRKYQNDGLEIVCLSFERARDYKTAQKRLAKMQGDLQMPYPVLLAGATRSDKAAEKLPMLNHVMSYPTAIYLDREHQVRKIHTGFAGPGTPVWEDYVSENDAFLQKLINQ